MMKLPKYEAADVQRLALCARSALIQLDADLFATKQAFRTRDEVGGLCRFDRGTLAADDRAWIEGIERRVSALNHALAAFDASLPNPASL